MNKMAFGGNRIKAREQAFFLCFSAGFSQGNTDEIIAAYSEQEKPIDFAVELSRGCIAATEQCDEIIKKYLKKWKLSRIPRVSKTLMRLAVYQLLFAYDKTAADNPVGVIVNDAVRLAKKYATDEDASFVNGVLGSIVKDMEGGGLKVGEIKRDE